MNVLKYPIGCFILWCDEYYRVVQNYSDYSATVEDVSGDKIGNFYFNYQGEVAVLVENKTKIKELEKLFNRSEMA